MRTRRTFVATGLAALLAAAGVTAAIAADPAPPPPPKIAFIANGRVPADALAAGPTAGQLGAPIFTTEQATLPDATANALTDYDPELVIVLGGPVAVADDVVNAIAAAVGLATVDPEPPPATGVVRAAGGDRFATAAAVADLLGAYDPAYLGVDLQAVDADLLDGLDSTDLARSPLHTKQPPYTFEVHDLHPGSREAWAGWVRFTSTGAGQTYIVSDLTAPYHAGPLGTPMLWSTLVELEICYDLGNGDSPINEFHIAAGKDLVLSRDINLTSTSHGCEGLPLPSEGVTSELPLSFSAGWDPAASARELNISGMRATWAPATGESSSRAATSATTTARSPNQ